MKRIERRNAAATALGIELNGKPMHELRKLLANDSGASERYAAIVGQTTPTPDPEPEAADDTPAPAKPASKPRTTRANKPAGKSGKVANPGKALTDALAKADQSMNGTKAKASA